jgi:hypothetical protein
VRRTNNEREHRDLPHRRTVGRTPEEASAQACATTSRTSVPIVPEAVSRSIGFSSRALWRCSLGTGPLPAIRPPHPPDPRAREAMYDAASGSVRRHGVIPVSGVSPDEASRGVRHGRSFMVSLSRWVCVVIRQSRTRAIVRGRVITLLLAAPVLRQWTTAPRRSDGRLGACGACGKDCQGPGHRLRRRDV